MTKNNLPMNTDDIPRTLLKWLVHISAEQDHLKETLHKLSKRFDMYCERNITWQEQIEERLHNGSLRFTKIETKLESHEKTQETLLKLIDAVSGKVHELQGKTLEQRNNYYKEEIRSLQKKIEEKSGFTKWEKWGFGILASIIGGVVVGITIAMILNFISP